MKEVYLVYARTDYSEEFENEQEGRVNQDESLRGVADSEVAAAGLILKDYLDTISEGGFNQEDAPLIESDYEGYTAYETHVEGEEDGSTWHYHLTWFVQSALVNELFETE